MFCTDNGASTLSINCSGIYRPANISYDIIANWSIDDPLAAEAARVKGYVVHLERYPGIEVSNSRAETMVRMDSVVLSW